LGKEEKEKSMVLLIWPSGAWIPMLELRTRALAGVGEGEGDVGSNEWERGVLLSAIRQV
jgi:hypothetical protein